MHGNPYQQYKKNQVEMASPEELVLLCYKGAIRYLKQALIRWDKVSNEDIHNYLMTAQALIEELTIGLNLDQDESGIAKNLLHLYDYMYRQLVEANHKKDPKPVQEVMEMLEDLKATWEEILASKNMLNANKE